MAIADPRALFKELCKERSESTWVEFKANNTDPDMIGKWASACANAAILAGKERAFLVFGVENASRKHVGTNFRLDALRRGNENLMNWLSRQITPRLQIEFTDDELDGKTFSIITVEPTYERPVRFIDVEYLRIGENVKKLLDFPEHERALWLATNRRKFEDAVALTHQTANEVEQLLDVLSWYKLQGEDAPRNKRERMSRLIKTRFIAEDFEGGYDIRNLGAILLAFDITTFPSIRAKTVRVIRYAGKDKSKSDGEAEFKQGYAIGFSSLIRYVGQNLPQVEIYNDGVRTMKSTYPDVAIREVIANAIIHQDLNVSGSSPTVEIYSDRCEVTNPGHSLIEIDRFIDERRSRNESLASTMRTLGLCEERGGGLDKAIFAIEQENLPPLEFHASENSQRVILFGPRPFGALSKAEKLRACFHHCIIKWLARDYMSNSSLRQRFRLADGDYQAASTIITQAVRGGRIVPAEKDQGNRNAKYVPYWAR